MKKILIIGAGSIGQRHLNALLSIKEKHIALFRTRKGKKKIPDEINNKVTIFYTEKDADNWNPSHIIISNPTSLHIKYLKKYLNSDVKIFIEKPIADSLNDLKEINISLPNVSVGYNLRFHKIIKTIKGVLQDNKYGDPIAAELNVGHYLPAWHPYEDYRSSYAAQKKFGGGVLKTLSHEIDLALFFFGKIKSVFAKVNKISNLDIDIDDYTTIFCESTNCKQIIINLNYLNPISSRYGKIYFNTGLLEYNFSDNNITFTDNQITKTQTIYLGDNDFDKQYIEQMKAFINADNDILCNYTEGVEVMKVIDACEISNKEKKEICLN